MDELESLKDSLSTRSSSWSQYITANHRPYMAKIWRNVYRGLKDDLKRTRWLHGLGWFMGIIWFSGLIVAACIIGIMTLSSTEAACQPDGSFRLHPDTFSMWSSSGFFQITLGGGNLTFAQAKVIDIVWDIVVGRGGQFLLALVSWKVFGKYLTICMEAQSITYQTFRTIFLQNEASLPSTCGIIKSFLWQRPLRSKVTMTFMIITMIFILAFPTIASAMSGYDANVSSYLPDYNKNFVPFNNFSRILYVVHDGWRLNQTGEFWITENAMTSSWSTEQNDPVLSGYQDECKDYRNHKYSFTSKNCELENDISDYVWKYGLGGLRNESSTFNKSYTQVKVELEAPILNISAYASPGDSSLGGMDQTEFVLPQAWVRLNETYPLAHVEAFGSCQTTGDYQWGFSFLQLFVCILLLLLWTIGIYILWLRAHFTLKLRGRVSAQTSGEHKAVLELAIAMQQELDIKHVDPSLLIEKQLKDRVENELKGGGMSYAPTYPDLEEYSFRTGTVNWFKREKWWFLTILLSSTVCGTFWLVPTPSGWWFWWWSFGLWWGLVFSMCTGTTNGSRILITLFWCILASVIIIACVIGFSYS